MPTNTTSDGSAERDDGIGRAEQHATPTWRLAADLAVHTVATRLPLFTSDDVWRELATAHPDERTHEPRALGAVMLAAVRDGLCEPTPDYRLSTRPVCHRNPKRVYRSRILQAGAA